jgi:serine/threonine protein phosphatase PrpC
VAAVKDIDVAWQSASAAGTGDDRAEIFKCRDGVVLIVDWYDLTAGQSRKPLIGSGVAEPVPFSGSLREGTLVIATDGLWNYVAQYRILEIVRALGPTSDIAAKLISAARLTNGDLNDDVAVAICKRSSQV